MATLSTTPPLAEIQFGVSMLEIAIVLHNYQAHKPLVSLIVKRTSISDNKITVFSRAVLRTPPVNLLVHRPAHQLHSKERENENKRITHDSIIPVHNAGSMDDATVPLFPSEPVLAPLCI